MSKSYFLYGERDYPMTISCFQGNQIINGKAFIIQSFVSAAVWVVDVAPVLAVLSYHKVLPFSFLP